MRHLLIMLLTISLFACQQENKEANSITFSGSIENANRSGILLMKGAFKQEIKLDETGSFTTILEDVEAGFYTLWDSVESTKVYFKPGSDLELNMDASKFDESIVYKGEGANVNNYLAKKFMFEEKMALDYKTIFSMEEADFIRTLDSVQKVKEDFVGGFSDLPVEFAELEKKSMLYEKLANFNSYGNAHAYYTKKENFKPTEAISNALSNIRFDDEEAYKTIDSYQRLVNAHYTSGEVMENIAMLAEIKSEAIKNNVLRSLSYSMRPGSDQLEEIYQGLMAQSNDEEFNKMITDNYNTYLKVAKGESSPSFSYPDTEGKMVSLEDLKGKVVYIDVWATWCGPCRAEIPYLKQLDADYHGKDVAFVSISVDKADDKQKWLDMVEKEELKGYQIFADKDWESDFVKAYGIRGIPRFILLDQQGNIVSPDAPRPSSGDELRDMIDELGI